MPSPPKQPAPVPVPTPVPTPVDEPSREGPSRPVPSAAKFLSRGLKLTARNWPSVLYGSLVWGSLVWLAGAIVAGMLLRSRVAAGAGPLSIRLPHPNNIAFFATRFSARSAGRIRDIPAFVRVRLSADVHAIHFRATHVHAAGAAVLALALLGIVLLFVFAAGTIQLYLDAEPTRPAFPVKLTLPVMRGIRHLWPFLRVGFLGALIAGAILAGLIATWFALLAEVSKGALGRMGAPAAILGALFLVLAALLLRLWLDLAELSSIERAIRGNRRTRQSLMPALKMLARRFVGIFPPFLLAGLLGAGLLSACLFLSQNLFQAQRIWPSLAVAALGFFLLPFFRFWQRGMGAVLVLALKPSVEQAAVAQLEPRVEPQVVRTASREEPQPEKLPSEKLPTEPTLQDLVKKLRNEPWASHAQASPYEALLFPASQSSKSNAPQDTSDTSLDASFDRGTRPKS